MYKRQGEVREQRVRGVEQPLREIVVMNKFTEEDNAGGVPEDFEQTGEPRDEQVAVSSDDDDGGDGEDVDDDDDEEEEDDDDLAGLAWEDVYSGEPAREATPSEDEAPARKEPRMTTSKRRAENFYTHANVKNRNRAKQAAASAAVSESRQRERGSRVGVNKKAARTSNPKLRSRK